MTRRFQRMRGAGRSARGIGVLVAVALALGVGSLTFAANRDDSTLAFLISTSDLGLLYGEFEEECPQGFELTLEAGRRIPSLALPRAARMDAPAAKFF